MNKFFLLPLLAAALCVSCSSDEEDATTVINNKISTEPTGSVDGHGYVDLGLSVKWATQNMGATYSTEKGDYYAWGESKAYKAAMDRYPENWEEKTNPKYIEGNIKTNYAWSTYKWATSSIHIFKYCCSDKEYDNKGEFVVDNKVFLDNVDDAASANWGSGWRMPTHEEMQELYDKCYWVWTASYRGSAIPGVIIYKAKNTEDEGVHIQRGTKPSAEYTANDRHIFLPAAGFRLGENPNQTGSYGAYWSNELEVAYPHTAYRLYFEATKMGVNSYERFRGYCVRPVIQ